MGDKGYAGVSEEFRQPKRKHEEQKDGGSENSEKWKNRRKRIRKAPKVVNKLCRFAAVGQACPKGDSCNLDHDVVSFIEKRPDDFGDVCPSFEAHGECQYGILCRFGGAHMVEGKNIVNEELRISNPKPTPANTVDRSVLLQLRKNSWTFKERASEEYIETRLRPEEIRKLDLSGKLMLPPLTTVGNLPFRRICKEYGADVTCGEMCFAQSLLKGNGSEFALIKRHTSEDFFGVQITASSQVDASRVGELLNKLFVSQGGVDFVDINAACPIDAATNRGCGAALLDRPNKLSAVVSSIVSEVEVPVIVKSRVGRNSEKPTIHKLIPRLASNGVSTLVLHGRSWYQRYKKTANWDYIKECADICHSEGLQIIGNGDIFSYKDIEHHRMVHSVDGVSIARAALLKPWIFAEAKERAVNDFDISASDRLDLYKKFCHYGLDHWGSDTQGVEKCRRFLLEWLGFSHRYIPAGVLERAFSINERSPGFVGRSELETLLASEKIDDWMKITEMVLAPLPEKFEFRPSHGGGGKGGGYE